MEKARIAQEQEVTVRDIEKNLVVETKQINQTRQVQEAEIQKNSVVETARIAQEQAVKERDIERTLHVEKARIAQEQAVQTRDIERNAVVETAQIDLNRQVQEAEVRKELSVQLMRIDAELEIERKNVVAKADRLEMKRQLINAEAEHCRWIVANTRLAVLLPKHINASELVNVIKCFLSEHAVVVVEPQKNAIIIRDVENCIQDAETIISRLDVPVS